MGVRRTLNLAPVLQVGARSREEARGGRYRPQPVADPHPGTRCGGHPLLEALPPPPCGNQPVPAVATLRWRPFFVYSPTFYGGHPGLGGKSCCRHNDNSMLTGAEIKRIQLLALRPPCLRRWRQPI